VKESCSKKFSRDLYLFVKVLSLSFRVIKKPLGRGFEMPIIKLAGQNRFFA